MKGTLKFRRPEVQLLLEQSFECITSSLSSLTYLSKGCRVTQGNSTSASKGAHTTVERSTTFAN